MSNEKAKRSGLEVTRDLIIILALLVPALGLLVTCGGCLTVLGIGTAGVASVATSGLDDFNARVEEKQRAAAAQQAPEPGSEDYWKQKLEEMQAKKISESR